MEQEQGVEAQGGDHGGRHLHTHKHRHIPGFRWRTEEASPDHLGHAGAEGAELGGEDLPYDGVQHGHPVKVGILWNMRGRVQLTWQMNLPHGGRENMMVLKLSIGLRLTYGPLNFFFKWMRNVRVFGWMDGCRGAASVFCW